VSVCVGGEKERVKSARKVFNIRDRLFSFSSFVFAPSSIVAMIGNEGVCHNFTVEKEERINLLLLRQKRDR